MDNSSSHKSDDESLPLMRQRHVMKKENPTIETKKSEVASKTETFFDRLRSYFVSYSYGTTSETEKTPRSTMNDLRGDYANVFILLLLYTLQGIPMGISSAIPLIMQERHAGYAAQAVFSIVTLPFSLKLLWAPVVDSLYSKRIGRRKSWMIPTQLLCGLSLLFLASSVDGWMGRVVEVGAGLTLDGDEGSSFINQGLNVSALSIFFVFLYFLMATQDIAVDAWALTMLRRRNVGMASTANNIGQYFGIYLANIGYLIFSSADTCNTYFRSVENYSDKGMLDVELYLQLCGLLFVTTTVIVGLFKKETATHEYDVVADALSKVETYYPEVTIGTLLKMKPTDELLDLEYTPQSPKSVKSEDNNSNSENGNQEITHHSDNSHDNDHNVDKPDEKISNDQQKEKTDTNVGGKSLSLKTAALTPLPDEDSDDDSCDLTTIKSLRHYYNVINNIAHGHHSPSNSLYHSRLLSVVLSESPDDEEHIEEEELDSVAQTFKRIGSLLSLSSIWLLVIFLLTSKIGTAAGDHITQLKLFDRGFTKADVAIITSLVSPLTVIIPMLSTSISTGNQAFQAAFLTMPVRVVFAMMWGFVVYMYPVFKENSLFYYLLVGFMGIQITLSVFQSVVAMSFFSKIADPRIGGTFITLLNTAANLGGSSTRMFNMYMVEPFTTYHCVASKENYFEFMKNTLPNISTYTSADIYNQTLNYVKEGALSYNIEDLSFIQRMSVKITLFLQNSLTNIIPDYLLNFGHWVSKSSISDGHIKSVIESSSPSDISETVFSPMYSLGYFNCKIDENIAQLCKSAHGTCVTYIDGYFVELILFGVVGLIGLSIMWRFMKHLDKLPLSAWRPKF